MVDAVRYAEKFENVNGSVTVTFPGDSYEYESAQDYRVPLASVIGADYSHDFMGDAPWLKGLGQETVRCIIWQDTAALVESAFDTLVSTCRKIGLGKLYTLDSGGTRRWAWAKLAGRPHYFTDTNQYFNTPTSLSFTRLSDWYATSLTTGSSTVTAGQSPKTVTINNPGNATVKGAAALVITAAALGPAGYSAGFTIANLTTGQSIATTRVSVDTNSRVQIDCERESVKVSTDAGVTYADDYASVTVLATQVALLELGPGDNTIVLTVGGTPNVTFSWSFYAPYE